MKKLLPLLLLATSLHAQQGYVSITADARNAVFGSDATENKPELNLNFKVALVGNKVVSHDSYECFMTLGYHEEYKMFYGCNEYDSELNIPNQLEMYNRLFEWHFDIHGLIDKNLAINLEEI